MIGPNDRHTKDPLFEPSYNKHTPHPQNPTQHKYHKQNYEKGARQQIRRGKAKIKCKTEYGSLKNKMIKTNQKDTSGGFDRQQRIRP
jgi:hypothetical protein